MYEKPFDLVTVGHLVIDLISTRAFKGWRVALGGPPTYVSVAAASLGSRVTVVSNVGEDFPDEYLSWLRMWGVDLSHVRRVSGARTTRFSIRYSGGERDMRLVDLAPPINLAEDLPNLDFKALHVAPVAGEVPYEVVQALRREGAVTSLDPQGFIRSFDDYGRVSLTMLKHDEVLRQVDILKASELEILKVTGLSNLYQAMDKVKRLGVKVVIVTLGERGSIIGFEGEKHFIEAFRVGRVVDPTGAGDVFIGAFLSEYVRGEDLLWSACVGSAAASFIVEGLGASNMKGRKEVYGRAQLLYEKVR